jgi:hypothetical protein
MSINFVNAEKYGSENVFAVSEKIMAKKCICRIRSIYGNENVFAVSDKNAFCVTLRNTLIHNEGVYIIGNINLT